MNIHIISIGDEILIGQIVNSNAAYIGELLNQNSYTVNSTSVIGDKKDELLSEFERTFSNNDVVICTGGLGPTHDDITLECIAKYFNTELVEDEDALNNIKEIFKKRDREITETNIKQALVPQIGTPIKNTLGTAPGVWIEKDGKIIISLPGVPMEMKAMMLDTVLPNLLEKFPPEFITKQKTLLTTGIPESFLYDDIKDIDGVVAEGKLAFLPSIYGVRIRITAVEEDEAKADEKIIEVEQKIRAKIGRNIFGSENETLEEVVGKLLKDRSLTLSIAESCTGGLISSRITNVSGSSEYFQRGLITYSNGAKVELLGIDEDLLQKHGAVSLEVAQQMADSVKGVSGTDIGIAVTGIMGPTGATEGKPIGLVYIAICDDKVCTAKEFHFGNDRLRNKERTSQAALEMIRRNLLGISYDT